MNQVDDIDRILDNVDQFALSADSLVDSYDEIFRDGRPFVSIEQFLEDDFYFGKIAKDLWPANRPEIEDIFNPNNSYIEVIFTGATSTGKTFMTCICLSYMIGQLGHYRNPHRWVGASPSSPIVFINMSINATKARDVIFARVKNMIDMSPYFNEVFVRDKRLSERLIWRIKQDLIKDRMGASIQFIPGTGDSLSALGDDVYGGAGDELNFFRTVEKSKKARGSYYDPAQALYDTISRRMKGRFMEGGLPIGKFFLLSSAQYPDDFIERRIEEAAEAGALGKTVKVVRKSWWEAKRGVLINGFPVYSDKTFRVEVGSSRRGSRILDKYDVRTGEVIRQEYDDIEGKVIEPPVDLWEDFCRDIEGAVRDFGGEVTRAINPFFPDSSVLYDAVSEEISHPWSQEETTLLDGSFLILDALFEKVKDEEGKDTGKWKLKRHPGKARYFHVDLGLTGDPAGLAVVHIAGWKLIRGDHGEIEDRPIYEVDLILRILPPAGGKIPFGNIRGILYTLRNHGMWLRFGSYDQFQSEGEIQILCSKGIDTKKVADSDSQMLLMKEAIYDGRLRLYKYQPIIDELGELEEKRGHIDHREGGHDDISRALSHAIFNAFEKELKASPEEVKSRLPYSRRQDRPKTDQEKMREAEEEIRQLIGGEWVVIKLKKKT